MEPETSIISALGEKYPFFPVTIQKSPADDNALWVCVFAVPPDQVRAVKNFIHDLRQRFDSVLLPMVKNTRTTKEHYPGMLQRSEYARLRAILQDFEVRAPEDYAQALPLARNLDPYCVGDTLDQLISAGNRFLSELAGWWEEECSNWPDDFRRAAEKECPASADWEADESSSSATTWQELPLAA